MTIRIFFVVISMALVGWFSYLSYNGVWRESFDLNKSVRIGGPSGFSGGRIK